MMASCTTPSLPWEKIANNTQNEDIFRLSLEMTESDIRLALPRKEEKPYNYLEIHKTVEISF